MDEETGTSSFAIDLPNGGASFIIGNSIQQGPETENSNVMSFGAEGLSNQRNELYFINNTVVNDNRDGAFIRIVPGFSVARVFNSIFCGQGDLLDGQATLLANILIPEAVEHVSGKIEDFVDKSNYDYRLTAVARAIDRGIEPGKVDDFDLKPTAHYIHPMQEQKRIAVKAIDAGAYEYMNLEGQ